MSVTVWRDGGCLLCRKEIALMRRLDNRGTITFVDVSDDASMCPLDRAVLLSRFHAEEDGRILTGAAAFPAMWRAIPLLRPFGLAACNSIILGALDRLYAGFLSIRPTLQRVMARPDGRAA